MKKILALLLALNLFCLPAFADPGPESYYRRIKASTLRDVGGNVGIGTSTAAPAALTVYGNSKMFGGIYAGGVSPDPIFDTSNRLVGYWKLDDNLATSVVLDAFTNGLNGTLSSSTNSSSYSTTGILGNAFNFDGAHYVTITDPGGLLLITGNITVSVWVKSTNSNIRIAGNRSSAGTNPGWQFCIDENGKANISVDTGTNVGTIIGNTTVNTGSWFHIVWKRTGSTLSLKVNDATDATPITIAGDGGTGAASMQIANSQKNHTNSTVFSGLIDDFRIYSGDTTDTEDTIIYNAGLGTTKYLNSLSTSTNKFAQTATAQATSFTGGSKDLYVEGNVQVDGSLYGSGANLTGIVAGGWTDGGTNIYATAKGDNIAIGTSTLSGKLTVAGNGTTTGINTQFQDSTGAAKVTILDSGNIGIGSTNPSALMSIVGGPVKIWTTAGTNTNAVSSGELYVEGDLEVDGSIYGDGVNITNIAAAGWSDGGTNVFLSANGDNVGIGTTALASGAKITVNGNGTTTGILTTFRDSAATDRLTILDVGNIGIGSSAPTAKLQISSGNINFNSASGTTNNWGFTSNSLTSADGLHLGSSSTGLTGNLLFVSATGSNAANTGNVGYISQTGSSSVMTTLMLTNGGGAGSTTFRANDTSSDTDATAFLIDATGNVGVGSSVPAGKFVVVGSGTTTGQLMHLKDSGNTSRVMVLDGGNVGIGSATPGAILTIPSLQSSSGTRYLCIDTAGNISSSASACSGT